MVDGGDAVRADDPRYVDFVEATSGHAGTPIADEWLGTPMLYSSGTTGRPKGILRPLPENPPSQPLPLFHFLNGLWQCKEGMRYLSPAPLYHSAPQANVALTIRNGGTVVIMEHFDPEQCLALIEQHRITHIQLVPTMFSRMLKLPESTRQRYDLSSLQIAVHAAAPCPVPVKEQMIDWWGPIIHEYYGATEGLGFTACNSAEWLAHKGTVGKVLLGELHVLDESMQPAPKGEPGELWFKTASPFVYFNDPERTPGVALGRRHDDHGGRRGLPRRRRLPAPHRPLDVHDHLGRRQHLPAGMREPADHAPAGADAAVFGVPNDDLGEEVKAVVQPMPGVPADEEFARSLIAFCRDHLAHMKCPHRSTSPTRCRACPPASCTSAAARPVLGRHASRIVRGMGRRRRV